MRLESEKRKLPDCVALTETGRCRQLETKQCVGENCPFLKNRQSCHEQEVRVYKRLASLDEETQQRISVKYYHGTRPWQPRKENAVPRRRRGRSQTTE